MTATASPPHWADAIDSPPQALADVQRALPVRLIATPRENLLTCQPGEPLSAVIARNTERYDHFPVADDQERIVGILNLVPYHRGTVGHERVIDRMARLSEDQLIGSDASILDFIETADRNPCRLVVAGSRIVGLVTLSDLQRLPVRAALFALITHAEITMASAIRRELPETERWLARLSPKRREAVTKNIERARRRNAVVEEILETTFSDKIEIIAMSPRLQAQAGAFREDMEAVRRLRNSLAHANGYASRRSDASRACSAVEALKRWIVELAEWPTVAIPRGN